jgi:hypothetical protein
MARGPLIAGGFLLSTLIFSFGSPALAQPFENPVSVAEEQKAKVATERVQRAEANVHLVSLAMESMQLDSPQDLATWPKILRDALPYSLGPQPFSAWSPQVQQFAKNKFHSLAETKQETPGQAPAGGQKPARIIFRSETERRNAQQATREWLSEPDPWRGVALGFHLVANPSVATFYPLDEAISQRGWQLSREAHYGPAARAILIPAAGDHRPALLLGSLMDSFSPAQRKVFLGNKMFVPLSLLDEGQKVILTSLFERKEPRVDKKLWTHENPDAIFMLDFTFTISASRTIRGQTQRFVVELAKPFKSEPWPTPEKLVAWPNTQ